MRSLGGEDGRGRTNDVVVGLGSRWAREGREAGFYAEAFRLGAGRGKTDVSQFPPACSVVLGATCGWGQSPGHHSGAGGRIPGRQWWQ